MKAWMLAALGAVVLISSTPALAQTAAPADLITPRLSVVQVFVADLERSRRFYRDVLGLPEPRVIPNYEIIFTLPGPNAPHLVAIKSEQPQANGSFGLTVANIDEVMSRVVEAGGRIVEPVQMRRGDNARIGVISDPDGARILVIQPVPVQ